MNPVTNLPIGRALAIETSGSYGSIALALGPTIIQEETFSHGLKHAAGLLPLIADVMERNGWKVSGLDCIYISHGPGSFTGLRIGITVAKTLAMVTGAKLVAVPSLRVLAMNAPADAQHVSVVLDAKRDQIFTARYTRQHGNLIEIEPAHLDSLDGMLSRSPRPIYLIGDGIPFHEKFLPTNRTGITVSEQPFWSARAGVVASIGYQLALHNEFLLPDQLNPVYVRKPEAQEKYEMNQRAHHPGPMLPDSQSVDSV